MQRTKLLAALLAATPLAFGEPPQDSPAHGAQNTEVEVSAMRLGIIPQRWRVVFDLSGSTQYRLVENEAEGRVTVIIDSADSDFNPASMSVYGTPIKKIRSTEGEDGTIAYEFELEKPLNPKLFILAPNETRGHRLVLDLHDTGEAEAVADKPAAKRTRARTRAQRPQPRSDYRSRVGAADRKPASRTPTRAAATEPDTGGEWSGYASIEPRLFFQSAAHPGQEDQHLSFAVQAEYFRDWADGSQRFAFSPFFRYDVQDDERTHADIRELYWRMEHNNILAKAGLDVVFWGVAESRHLVDIINQTDLVENIDGEDKLGQPMVNLDYMSNIGTWQFYVLPYFRERTFPGEDGRLRSEPATDEDDAEYESGDEEEHIDFAVRWSHYIGDWDIGIAHFSGTSREPLLLLEASGGDPKIIPLYPQIEQTSLDTQATIGAWLWKLEAIYNDNDFDSYYATVGGFEYTWYGVRGGDADIGLLLEYNYDERGEDSTSVLQDDVYLGMRWSGNDINSTEFLAAVVVDTDNDSVFGNIEASRRLGEHWTLGMEIRVFTNVDDNDLLSFIEEDDYAEFQITRHF